MKGDDISKRLKSSFSISRVGHISEYVEPVSCYDSLDEARKLFLKQPDLTSMPVEREGGVVGLLSRETVLKKGRSAWEALKGNTLDKYMDISTLIIDAQENSEKALDEVLSQDIDSIYNDFLIYHNGKYFGIGTFLKLTKHISTLRNMDLELAKNMQEFLMNKREIKSSLFSIEKYVKMVHELGGDFYQILEINKDLFMIACFDVSGKGVAASLTTSIISAFFATLEVGGYLKNFDPQSLVVQMNNLIIDQTPAEIFIAGAMLFIDLKKMEIQSFNMGYSPIYNFYSEKSGKLMCKILNPNIKPMGIDDFLDLDKYMRVTPIQDNMKIFIYSDGLTDARNNEGEMYGEDNLKQFLIAKSKLKANDLIKDLNEEIVKFIGKAPQADDITALAIQFK